MSALVYRSGDGQALWSPCVQAEVGSVGLQSGRNAFQDAFNRFKDLADKKKNIFDEDIEALVDDEVGAASDKIKVIAMTVIAGTSGVQKAIVTLDMNGTHVTKEATGDGPVDAIFNAIKQMIPHKARLMLYQVSAVTAGTDAQAEVSCRLREGEHTVTRAFCRYRHHGLFRQSLCLSTEQADGSPGKGSS